MWVDFKCPVCGKDLEDDKELANFMICTNNSHGVVRFYTMDSCYFTMDQKIAEKLMLQGRRVHITDPKAPSSSTVQLE